MGFVRRSFLRVLERVSFCFYSRTFTPSEHQLPNRTPANTTRQTTLRAEDEVGDGFSGLCPDGRRYRSNHCLLVVHVKRGFGRLQPSSSSVATPQTSPSSASPLVPPRSARIWPLRSLAICFRKPSGKAAAL